jgi:sugar/nucleoside kinase (ribokinase family)
MIDVSVQAGALASGGDVHGDVRIRPGGGAANAAVWAAAEGALVTLVGRVGDDAMGRMLSEALRERGVETALAVDAQARTGTMLVVRQANERSMVADRGANACLRADDLPKDMTADAVLVSGYLLFAEGSEAAALAALERADAPIVAVEASSWPLLQAYGPERFLAVTSRASLLLANEREAEVLFGPARQMDRGLRVAIKRGPKGALLVGWGKALDVPAPSASEAVDPTGAGDAFDGVLIAALAAGLSIELALERAVAAGSRVAANHDTWPEP